MVVCKRVDPKLWQITKCKSMSRKGKEKGNFNTRRCHSPSFRSAVIPGNEAGKFRFIGRQKRAIGKHRNENCWCGLMHTFIEGCDRIPPSRKNVLPFASKQDLLSHGGTEKRAQEAWKKACCEYCACATPWRQEKQLSPLRSNVKNGRFSHCSKGS